MAENLRHGNTPLAKKSSPLQNRHNDEVLLSAGTNERGGDGEEVVFLNVYRSGHF